jgi:hypothetical protein
MVHIQHTMDETAKFACLDINKFSVQNFKIQGFCSCYNNVGV